jgi:hypothetical protein
MCIISKAMYSYIPNPCGTSSVFFASFFQVVSPQVISSPSGSSQCSADKVKRINPRRYVMIKRLQVISTSGLASFLGPFCFGTFWRFYSKGGECETKASLWLKLTSGFKDMRAKGENVNIRSKRGKFDLGEFG